MKRSKNMVIYLLIAIFAVIGVWIYQIMTGRMPYVDKFTREFVGSLENTLFYDVFHLITNLGSEFFLVPLVIVVSILLYIWFKSSLVPLFFAGGTLLSHSVNLLIKDIVARERPSVSVAANAEGFSFPSGHSMIPMVCYGLLAYFITRKLNSKGAILGVQIFFAFLVFLIGISRYVINVHYLTDILPGFFFGFLLLIALIYLYEFIQSKRSPS